MFGKRKKIVETFDRAEKRPVIRCSICTGEQVAGFQNLKTGKFEEVTVLRSTEDRQEFLEKYGIRDDEIEKIW
ncbi:MAG: aspartate dehydrogenase [Oliverpabstia sp.]